MSTDQAQRGRATHISDPHGTHGARRNTPRLQSFASWIIPFAWNCGVLLYNSMKLGLEGLLHLKDTFSKKNLARAVASVALPFMMPFMANNAKAAEGSGSAGFSVEGIGSNSFTWIHWSGGLPGPEDDGLWIEFYNPDGITGKSTCGGYQRISLPSAGEPGGFSVDHSIVIAPGHSLDIPSPGAHYTIGGSSSGYEGYKVTISESEGIIAPGHYTGSISVGSNLVSITKITSTDPNNPNPDPNNPGWSTDPNSTTTTPVIVKPVNPDPKWGKEDPVSFKGLRNFDSYNTLFISNLVEGLIENQVPRALGLWLKVGAQDIIDNDDLLQSSSTNYAIDPLIVSEVIHSNQKKYNVKIDVRDPGSPNLDFTVKLQFDTNSGTTVNLGYQRKNCLSFAYPVESMKDTNSNTKRFGGKTPTLWINGVDSPVWDVDKIIRTNNGVFQLLATQLTYAAKTDYFVGTVSFNRPVGDVVRNGKVDANDYNLVQSKLGFVGPTPADVWGPLGLGMPDGKVDSNDVDAIYKVLPPEEKAKVTPPQDYKGSLTSRVPSWAKRQALEHVASGN